MSWFEELKKQHKNRAASTKQKPIRVKCPDCGGEALIWAVAKVGRNQGRPILFCADKTHCKFTKWMDLPSCDICGNELYEARVMSNGKNKGKHYRACPNKCEGAFRWA